MTQPSTALEAVRGTQAGSPMRTAGSWRLVSQVAAGICASVSLCGGMLLEKDPIFDVPVWK